MLFQYECGRARDALMTFPGMLLLNYDNITGYQSWESARDKPLQMGSSIRDQWGALCVVKPLGDGYSINSNWVAGSTTMAELEGDEADGLISQLISDSGDRAQPSSQAALSTTGSFSMRTTNHESR